MLPAPRLMFLVMAAAPLFLAGAFFPPFTGVGVLYLILLAVWAVVDAVTLPRRRDVDIRQAHPARMSLGVPNLVALELLNAGRSRLHIALAEDLHDSMTAEPDLHHVTLEPRERAKLEYHLTPTRRGRYELGRVDVRLLRRGGLFYRQFKLDLRADIDVYPNLLDVKRYDLLLRRGLLMEQGVSPLRQIGQGSEFESLRQYTIGDDMSRVAWKVTAKHSKLIVRNYQPERQQSVLVAIDVGRATAGEFDGISRLDYLVNAALMLAYVTLRQGDWFSMLAFSDTIESYLPPVRHVQNIDRVAQALYRLEPRLRESDYGTACRFLDLKNKKRGLICLMTDVIDREASGDIIGYLAHFARYHLPVAVTLADPAIKEAAVAPIGPSSDAYRRAAAIDVVQAREQALAVMRRRGVSVLDVHPRSLTPELVNRYLLIKSQHRL